MKKIVLIFALVHLLSFSLIAQTSKEKIENFKKINQQVIAKYQDGKYKDALRTAEQALAMSIEIFGAEHNETATSYSNLGEIYRAKKDYDEAIESFEKALTIYQKNPSANEKKIAGVLKSLGTVLAFDGKKEKAVETLLKSLANAEKVYGNESKEILPYLTIVSEMYVIAKEYDKANDFFIRRYLTSLKVFGEDSDELQIITDQRYCLLLQVDDTKASDEREKVFYDAISKAKGDKKSPITDNAGIAIDGGVVNGKAVSLPKPEYPPSARASRAGGAIPVKVSIDEQGNVTSAKALCDGHPALKQSSEDAARKAKFAPTTLSGVPVKVTGIILYKFVP